MYDESQYAFYLRLTILHILLYFLLRSLSIIILIIILVIGTERFMCTL